MSTIRLQLLIVLLAPAVALAETETIELKSGDRVTGSVVERTDEKIVLEHGVFGRVEIPLAELKPVEPPNPGLFGTDFLEGWTRTFSLGLSGQKADSDTSDLVVALESPGRGQERVSERRLERKREERPQVLYVARDRLLRVRSEPS